MDRHGPERNARLAAVASRQWGNVTRPQLRAIGFSDREVAGMARRIELQRMHRGVYAVGHVPPAPEARWSAALLAGGSASALTHTGALAAYGLIEPRYVTEIRTPTRRRGDERLRVHTRPLAPTDVMRHRGLRVTTVARTLLDIAAAGWPIDRLTHQAAAAGLASLDDLRVAAAPAAGRGASALRDALAIPHTRSKAERRLLAFLLRERLPVPEMNAQIGRLRVDGFWAELNLAVELDPDQTHGSAWAQRDDAWRDRYVAARGVRLLRIEERDFAHLADELRRLAAPAA